MNFCLFGHFKKRHQQLGVAHMVVKAKVSRRLLGSAGIRSELICDERHDPLVDLEINDAEG